MRQFPLALSCIERIALVFFVFLSSVSFSFSQTAHETRESKIHHLFQYAEQHYNTNDKLVNGFIYNLPDRRIDGHPYLEENQWVLGTLFIGGDAYDQVLLKYDLTQDDVILKARMINGKYKAIELTHEHVDSFRLGNRHFVNSNKFIDQDEDMAYYEQILDDRLIYIRKHSKYFIAKYDVLTPHGRFSELQTRNYFIVEGKLTDVTGKGSFIRFFPKSKRKKIRRFLRKENIRYRKASSAEMRRLLEYCNQIIYQ